jgi:alpha-glucuronidase
LRNISIDEKAKNYEKGKIYEKIKIYEKDKNAEAVENARMRQTPKRGMWMLNGWNKIKNNDGRRHAFISITFCK